MAAATQVTAEDIRSIEQIEQEFKIPVVSANQATIWAGLRHLKIPATAVTGAGSLFRRTA